MKKSKKQKPNVRKTYLRNKGTREINTKIDVTEIGLEVLDYF